jgi:hypothetical protein
VGSDSRGRGSRRLNCGYSSSRYCPSRPKLVEGRPPVPDRQAFVSDPFSAHTDILRECLPQELVSARG